jgi:hypothetical protein
MTVISNMIITVLLIIIFVTILLARDTTTSVVLSDGSFFEPQRRTPQGWLVPTVVVPVEMRGPSGFALRTTKGEAKSQ